MIVQFDSEAVFEAENTVAWVYTYIPSKWFKKSLFLAYKGTEA